MSIRTVIAKSHPVKAVQILRVEDKVDLNSLGVKVNENIFEEGPTGLLFEGFEIFVDEGNGDMELAEVGDHVLVFEDGDILIVDSEEFLEQYAAFVEESKFDLAEGGIMRQTVTMFLNALGLDANAVTHFEMDAKTSEIRVVGWESQHGNIVMHDGKPVPYFTRFRILG